MREPSIPKSIKVLSLVVLDEQFNRCLKSINGGGQGPSRLPVVPSGLIPRSVDDNSPQVLDNSLTLYKVTS